MSGHDRDLTLTELDAVSGGGKAVTWTHDDHCLYGTVNQLSKSATVTITFEHGDLRVPYIIGGLYQADEK